MDQIKQVEMLTKDLDRFIERYRDEFDLSYAAVVGVLNIKAQMMTLESLGLLDEEDQVD